MPTDQYIDLSTRDYVATSDGAWLETDDSRTAMIMQLECHYNAWWGDAPSGSRIHEMLSSGEPVEPLELKAECERAGGMLVAEGMISDLVVTIAEFDPLAGALQINLQWWDRASNSPVNIVYTPLGGVPR